MPGIVGILAKNKSIDTERVLADMINSVKHQNWYSTDKYLDKTTSVGIGRVDLGITHKKSQPYTNANKSIFIFIYGEIYGARNEKEPAPLLTGDLHLILKAYEEKQELCAQNFIGDFTIVIFDKNNKKLFVINDRYGRRPLYYYNEQDYVGFGSELKSLLRLPKFKISVSQKSIAEFLTFGYMLGDRTLLSSVRLLPPAGILEYNIPSHDVRVSSYWKLSEHLEPLTGSDSNILDAITYSFCQGVQKQLDKDQEVGVSLSGGMDSRTLMSVIDPKEYPVKAITVAIPGSYEEGLAKNIARVTGCKHTFYESGDRLLTSNTVMELTREAIALTDGMRGASYSIITVYTAKKLREYGFDIVMTGHAGELAKLDMAYNFSLRGNLPQQWNPTTFLEWSFGRMTKSSLGNIDIKEMFKGEFYDVINDVPRDNLKRVLAEIDPALPVEQKTSYLFLNELFRKRAFYAMAIQRAYAVVRLPFLDDDFIEQVIRTPLRLRKNHNIHRSIIQRYNPKLLDIPLTDTRMRLDASIIEKLTRGIPYKLLRRLGLFKQDVAEDYYTNKGNISYFQDIFLDERTLDRGLVNGKHLQILLEDYKRGDRRSHDFFHLLAIVELWHRMFIDKEP